VEGGAKAEAIAARGEVEGSKGRKGTGGRRELRKISPTNMIGNVEKVRKERRGSSH